MTVEKLRERATAKLYWMRVILATIAAYIAFSSQIMGKGGILFGILVYFLSYWIAKYGLRLRAEDVGGMRRLIFTGFGSYLLLFIVFWALLYSLQFL